MDIEYVTHASLRLAGQKTLLLDPFYFLDDTFASWVCHYPPRDIDPAELGSVDYVFSSHLHSDHSHPRTLARLKAQIRRVVLPAERPALVQRYRTLGFEDITLLDNGKTVRLDDDLEVTCLWSDPVDSVLVIRSGDVVVMHQNDCHLSDELVRHIGQRFRIDYAFLCYTMAQDLYPLLLERPASELEELTRHREEAHFLYNLRCVDAWEPRVVVPYSMTMTYFDPAQQHLNGYGRLVPAEFCERVRRLRPDVRAVVAHPGDIIDAATGDLREARGPHRWGANLGEYLANIDAYVRAAGSPLPSFDAGVAAATAPRFRAFLQDRLDHQPLVLALSPGREFAFHVVGAGGDRETFGVDLDTRRVTTGERLAPAFLEFTLPARIAELLIAGEVDPFEILFSYRVKCRYSGRRLAAQEESNLIVLLFVALLQRAP